MQIGLFLGINNPILRTTSGGVTPPLDDYTGAESAYSMNRLLRSGYGGSAFRVRRSSDNSEQDIGFLYGNVDESSITSFIGSDTAYITTIYDQSGNGNNFTQATASAQGTIATAGALDKEGGKIALTLTKSNRYDATGHTSGTVQSAYLVTKGYTLSNKEAIFGVYTTGGGAWIGLYQWSTGEIGFNTWNSDVWGFNGDFQNRKVYTLLFKNGNPVSSGVVIKVNDSAQSLSQLIGTSTTRTMANGLKLNYGGTDSITQNADQKFQELIIYNSDNSANDTGLNTNINDYYGIY